MAQVWTLVQDISALWRLPPGAGSTAGIYSVTGGPEPFAIGWGDTIPPKQGHTYFDPTVADRPPYGTSWFETLREAQDHSIHVATNC